MKKWIAYAAGITAIVSAAAGVYVWVKQKNAAIAVSIIGGADGPTSVFVAGKVHDRVAVAGALAAGLCLLGIWFFFRKRRKK